MFERKKLVASMESAVNIGPSIVAVDCATKVIRG